MNAAQAVAIDHGAEVAPAPAARKTRRRLRSYVLPAFVFLVFVYLFLPLLVVVVFSFNHPTGKFNTRWHEFTLQNWLHPFRKVEYTQALVVSLKVAALSCIVATIFGAMMALAMSRYRFRGKSLVNLIVVLPLTAPEIVMGSSLFTLFFGQNLDLGFGTILIAHIMFCISYVALTVQARLRGFEWTLEDAAMDLGSSPWRTFRTVTFPLILPAIGAAALLSIALSIDDYIITSFVAGDSTVTFPMQIYNSARVEIPPQVHVLASAILFVCVAILAVGVLRAMRRKDALS